MATKHWLSAYGTIPHEINPDRYTSLVDMLDEAMRRFSGKRAFCSAGQSLTYAEVDRLSAAFCAYLQHVVGVVKGDRIAVMLPNIAAFPIAFLGIARAGAVQVNVNPLYTPRELEHQLKDADCKVIVVFNGSTPTLADVIARTGLKTIITTGVGGGLGVALPSPPVDVRLLGSVTLEAALDTGAVYERLPVELSGSDLLFLQYTGGTSGLSKGAALSHRNLIANTEQFKAFMIDTLHPGEETIVTAIPLYHILALMANLITYFSVGAENWLVANPRDLDGLIDVLTQARPTVFTGVNTLYAALTMHPRIGEVDWSRLRLAAGGGAAIMRETSDRWQKISGSFIREGYGLSETSPVLAFNPAYINAFTGTSGLPLPSTDIKILDDHDQEVALDEPGEICAKGPQVMQGYWRNPDANSTSFTDNGYFRTGDIGVFDAKGFLRIIDRKKDMIIVSGFNVYPAEVEAVASSCTGVAECACVGMPDEKTGEAVNLFVVRSPHSDLDKADLIEHCRARMAAYKVPKTVRFVDVLPKSSIGKILRRALRADSTSTAPA